MRTTALTHRSSLRAAGHVPGQKGQLRSHRQIMPPSLHLSDSAAASVFRAVRLRGPVGRDVIAGVTSLSIATVNRQVIALLEAGLLRERADLAVSGAIGRPRVPVEVNHEPFVTLGIHIGARTTSIVATDLFGRTLDTVETPTPLNAAGPALASLADSAARYLRRWHRRRPLWVGVAIGGAVDSATGHVDHARAGLAAGTGGARAGRRAGPAGVGRVPRRRHGRRRAAARHAAVRAELTDQPVRLRPRDGGLCAGDRRAGALPLASGPGTIAPLPVHSELLGGTGQLESTVSDEAVLAAARRLRVLPSAPTTRIGGSATAITDLLRVASGRQPAGQGAADGVAGPGAG